MGTRRSGRVGGVSWLPEGLSGRAEQFQRRSGITGRKGRHPHHSPGAVLTLFALITFLLVPVLTLLPLPQAASALSVTPAVSAGSYHTVGLRSNGTVVAVGSNWDGMSNVENWMDMDIVQVSAGDRHTVGLRSNGTVVAVGWNAYGQCNVGGWTDIVQVSAGYGHTVGLRSDRTAVAVGYNAYGQCNVGGWTDIVQVSADLYHTVGLRSDRTAVAVGANWYGQCNVGTWTNIVQVSAGDRHTVGLRSGGTVVAVGDNGYGQCNVGTWTNIVQVSAGLYHTVGLRSGGTVVAVGWNGYGQCNVGGWMLDVSGTAPPDTPANRFPRNREHGVSLTPVLQASDFSDPDAGDVHTASQWQIRTSSGSYSSPVFDSKRTTNYLTSINVPWGTLNYGTTYFWRVRYQDKYGNCSRWSAETSFTTYSPPETPTNRFPRDKDRSVSLTPTLRATSFDDADVGDVHSASQWQIRDEDYNLVFDSGIDTTNLTSITIPSGVLNTGTAYYWRVRYQDRYDLWSEWSAETSFTTSKVPETPTNLSPGTGTNVGLTPTLESSRFSDPNAVDSHAASHWQITGSAGDYSKPVFDSGIDATNLTSITIPSGVLNTGTAYYWRVRHQDDNGLWSDWSAETSFTAGDDGIAGLPLWAWILVGIAVVSAAGGVLYFIRKRPASQ